jgi:general secretion pathway protein D
VPILGDIPLIGFFFRSTTTQSVKKDLMVFLRPVVIQSANGFDSLTKSRYDFMRDVAILNANGHGDLIATSMLPPEHMAELPVPFPDEDASDN